MKSVTSCVRAALYVAIDHSAVTDLVVQRNSAGSPNRSRNGASTSVADMH